jgi:hypothetical protein
MLIENEIIKQVFIFLLSNIIFLMIVIFKKNFNSKDFKYL